jgi:hypothetical protein
LLYSKYRHLGLLFTQEPLFAVQQIRLQMISSEAEVVQELIEAINAIPHAHANLKIEAHKPDAGYDAQIDAIFQDKHLTFIVQAKRQVYPRDVHQYVYQTRQLAETAKGQFGGSVILLLASHSISPGARELLRESHHAYFASGGSLFVDSNGLLLDRDRPPAPSEERAIRTLFTGTRARILLAMLDRPKEWINVKHLSRDADVSTATASEVLQALERNDWVMTEGAGPNKQRRLTRPGDLLDAWAKFTETRKPPKQRRYFVPNEPIDATYRIPQILEKYQVEYALTGEAAAQHFAPWLTHISTLRFRMVYSDRVEAALSALGAKLTSEGANVSVIEVSSPKDIAFRRREGDVWYAHPIQIYLDLLRLEGRARDAARHLREQVIGF